MRLAIRLSPRHYAQLMGQIADEWTSSTGQPQRIPSRLNRARIQGATIRPR